MTKNQKILLAAIALVAVSLYFLIGKKENTQKESLTTQVNQGSFVSSVSATGELKAKKSKKIMGPQSMRSAQIYETTIQNLVPEGTVVSEGDFVATLDKTEIANRMADIQSEVDKVLTQLEQAKIDTTIEMRGLRDQIANTLFSLEENKLQVELNKYEPQAIIRQKNIEYEKAERSYAQLVAKLDLTQEKNNAKIAEITASLNQQKTKLKRLQDLAKEFTIKAPADGMVIYSRNWEGKVATGSRLRAWDPVVAELPDLSEMISKTYVNEVDISKVSTGQDAIITVDAFPDKKYSGVVQQVANIGEQLRDYDTKVFEVVVSVEEQDSILRPAMTTGIEIIIDKLDSVNYVPLEALFKDSLSFVYIKDGKKVIKQEVLSGPANDVDISVLAGLEKDQLILLAEPEEEKITSTNFLEESLKAEILKRQESRMKDRMQALEEKKKQLADDIEIPQSGGNSIIIF